MNFDDPQDTKMSFDAPNEAQAQQQGAVSSLFPLPPTRYIKLFTDKCKSYPPPKPFSNGQYLMFGQTIMIDDTIIRSLESQGLRRLYPREYDHKRELKKINASILVNFLDLIDVLIRCPDTIKREEKCNDLQLLFITMHHLINELRPHQARESIRVLLQVQKRQRIEITSRLNKQIEKVQEMITTAAKGIKDYDINVILKDSLPDNFHKPEATAKEAGERDEASAAENGDCISKLTEMDAFMCDLVDELV